MLSFIGGTGPEGMGLAVRFLMAGEDVIIGSRTPEKASGAVEKLIELLKSKTSQQVGKVRGLVNREAVKTADMVIITVPFQAQADTVSDLKDALDGRIVVDTVVPLKFAKGVISAVSVEEGSAAEQAQGILSNSTVISAFHNLSAETLIDLDERLDNDVVVCGDDSTAKATIIKLAEKIDGIRAIDGGGLTNSRYVEDLTALLLNINKIHKAHSSIKITGV